MKGEHKVWNIFKALFGVIIKKLSYQIPLNDWSPIHEQIEIQYLSDKSKI